MNSFIVLKEESVNETNISSKFNVLSPNLSVNYQSYGMHEVGYAPFSNIQVDWIAHDLQRSSHCSSASTLTTCSATSIDPFSEDCKGDPLHCELVYSPLSSDGSWDYSSPISVPSNILKRSCEVLIPRSCHPHENYRVYEEDITVESPRKRQNVTLARPVPRYASNFRSEPSEASQPVTMRRNNGASKFMCATLGIFKPIVAADTRCATPNEAELLCPTSSTSSLSTHSSSAQDYFDEVDRTDASIKGNKDQKCDYNNTKVDEDEDEDDELAQCFASVTSKSDEIMSPQHVSTMRDRENTCDHLMCVFIMDL